MASLVVMCLSGSAQAVAVGGGPNPLSAEALMADLRRQTDAGWRRQASPALRETAKWICGEFERSGLETVVESWPFEAYYPKRWGARVTKAMAGGVPRLPWKANSYPIWYTEPADVEAEVTYVGAGTPAEIAARDVRGKIVLVESTYLLNFAPTDTLVGAYEAAVKAGAVGFVRSADAPQNQIRLMHFDGLRADAVNGDTLERNPALSIPGLVVGASDFAELRRAALAGGMRMKLEIETENPPKGGWRRVRGGSLGPGRHLLRGVMDDVVGVLPGRSNEVIVVGAHYDSTFTGASDNATGVAGLLGLMRHFAAKPVAERPKTMIFLAAGGHEAGFFDLFHLVKEHEDDFLSHTVAFDWLDHLAAEGAIHAPGTHGVIETGMDEFRGTLGSWNSALMAYVYGWATPHGVFPGPWLGPLSSLERLPEYVPSFDITQAYPWYHTPLDTPEKIPPEQLQRHVAAQRDILADLQRADGAALRSAQASPKPIPSEPWKLEAGPSCAAIPDHSSVSR